MAGVTCAFICFSVGYMRCRCMLSPVAHETEGRPVVLAVMLLYNYHLLSVEPVAHTSLSSVLRAAARWRTVIIIFCQTVNPRGCGPNMFGFYLIGSDLIGVDLIGSDFIGFDLIGVDLIGAGLIGFDLNGMEGFVFNSSIPISIWVDLILCRMRSAWTSFDWIQSDLVGSDLIGFDLI